MIEVKDLTKRYGPHIAVEGLSFQVEKGQIYGFLGPNGAGKSTTMNIMTGYIGPTEGQVLVDGISIVDEPEKAKMKIGYLPEQPPLYHDMTVLEYLQFAAGIKKIPKSDRATQIEQVMDMTQIEHVQNRLIKNLSKGYRQRVGLAQAILGFPEIIILDEPTVGLDPKQIIEIRALIKNLSRKHTIILSSHILSEIQEICDNILIIHHGKTVACGTQDALINQFSSSSSLRLTVKGDAEKALNALSAAVRGCEIALADKSAPGEVNLTISNIGDKDVREQIFSACVKSNLPILEMKNNIVTLEDIFLQLTSEPRYIPDEEDFDEENSVSDAAAEASPELNPAPREITGQEENPANQEDG